MEWDKIWAINKNIVDAAAARYTVLLSKGLVPFTLAGAPAEPFAQAIACHPKDESLGKKIRHFAPTVYLQADDAATMGADEEITLMSWGNAIVRSVTRDASGAVVALAGELNLAGSVKSTKKKVTWLAKTDELVSVELLDFDFLLAKDKVEEEDAIENVLTAVTKFSDAALGEGALRQLKRGDVVQVERRGFYICDAPYVRAEDPIRLFFVPDGKNMMGVKRA